MLSVKLLASLLLLSVAAEASSKFCKKNVPLLEGCIKRGYQAKIFKNCTTSEGKMEKKERKSCAKIEKKISKKCESFECGTTNDTEVIFHIRGPKAQNAMIGQGSSITCSIAAPEEDVTFEMYVNGRSFSKLSPDSPWNSAGFKRSTYDWNNGTVSTDIEGFVEKFTGGHNNTAIYCTSYKYPGHVSLNITLHPDNSTHNQTEWTPIFNSTSNMVGPFNSSNLPVFKLKFTENKVADKYLYQGVNVNLYNGNGTRLGHTNYIIYARSEDEEVKLTGYKRFYFSGPWSGNRSCSEYLNLDYLEDFNFEMVTSVGSEDMFQFTRSSGEKHSESMGDCSSYSSWQDMLLEAESADLGMITWTSDLPDYFTTEYSVTQ